MRLNGFKNILILLVIFNFVFPANLFSNEQNEFAIVDAIESLPEHTEEGKDELRVNIDVSPSGENEPGVDGVGSVSAGIENEKVKLNARLNLDDLLNASSLSCDLNISDDASSFIWTFGSILRDEVSSAYTSLDYTRLWGDDSLNGYGKNHNFFSKISGYFDERGTDRLNLTIGGINGKYENVFSYRWLRKNIELFSDFRKDVHEHGMGYEHKCWFSRGFLKNIGVKGTYFNCLGDDEVHESKYIGGYSKVGGSVNVLFGFEKKDVYQFLTEIEAGFDHCSYKNGYSKNFVHGFRNDLITTLGKLSFEFHDDGKYKKNRLEYSLLGRGANLKIYTRKSEGKEVAATLPDKESGVEISILPYELKNIFKRAFWENVSLKQSRKSNFYTSPYQVNHIDGFDNNDLVDNPVAETDIEINPDDMFLVECLSDFLSEDVKIHVKDGIIIVDPVTMLTGIHRIEPEKQKSACSISNYNLEIDLRKISHKGDMFCIAYENNDSNEETRYTVVKLSIDISPQKITIKNIKAKTSLTLEKTDKFINSDYDVSGKFSLSKVKNLKLSTESDSGVSFSDGITKSNNINIIFDRVPGASSYKIKAKNGKKEIFFDAGRSDHVGVNQVQKNVYLQCSGKWNITVTAKNGSESGPESDSLKVKKYKEFYIDEYKIEQDLKFRYFIPTLWGSTNIYNLYISLPVVSDDPDLVIENIKKSNWIYESSDISNNLFESHKLDLKSATYDEKTKKIKLRFYLRSSFIGPYIVDAFKDGIAFDLTLGLKKPLLDRAGNGIERIYKKFRIPNAALSIFGLIDE